MAQVQNLRVEPEKLVSTAKIMKDAVSNMRQDFVKLGYCISGTKTYWLGAAGDAHRKLYDDVADEIETLLGNLEAYPLDILDIVGLYEEKEKLNEEQAMSLKSNIIH